MVRLCPLFSRSLVPHPGSGELHVLHVLLWVMEYSRTTDGNLCRKGWWGTPWCRHAMYIFSFSKRFDVRQVFLLEIKIWGWLLMHRTWRDTKKSPEAWFGPDCCLGYQEGICNKFLLHIILVIKTLASGQECFKWGVFSSDLDCGLRHVVIRSRSTHSMASKRSKGH